MDYKNQINVSSRERSSDFVSGIGRSSYSSRWYLRITPKRSKQNPNGGLFNQRFVSKQTIEVVEPQAAGLGAGGGRIGNFGLDTARVCGPTQRQVPRR